VIFVHSNPNLVDGGGVRGVSELRVLRRVMDGLPKVPLDASKPMSAGNSRAPHPYEVFDMMAGTSTGGYERVLLTRKRLGADIK
jgi:patatin-like phospholipase/acyl hydrolase